MKEVEEKLGCKWQSPQMTLDEHYQQHLKQQKQEGVTDDYQMIRGPRPWEDPNDPTVKDPVFKPKPNPVRIINVSRPDKDLENKEL